MKTPHIKLRTSDMEIFEVDVEIAKHFDLLKPVIEELDKPNNKEKVYDLKQVRSEILKQIIIWVTHHKDDPPLPEDYQLREKRTDDISPWDADFMKSQSSGLILELTTAAYHLGITPLVDLNCKTAANLIKGRTPQEMRTILDMSRYKVPSAAAYKSFSSEYYKNK